MQATAIQMTEKACSSSPDPFECSCSALSSSNSKAIAQGTQIIFDNNQLGRVLHLKNVLALE